MIIERDLLKEGWEAVFPNEPYPHPPGISFDDELADLNDMHKLFEYILELDNSARAVYRAGYLDLCKKYGVVPEKI